MFHLTYSNHYEELADALAETVARSTDPFATATIVVPNRSVASYLEFSIARRNGIAANLRFPFLESLLADGLLASSLHDNASGAIDRAQLHALLCSLFADLDYLNHPDLGPVRAYLHVPADNSSRVVSDETEHEEDVGGSPRPMRNAADDDASEAERQATLHRTPGAADRSNLAATPDIFDARADAQDLRRFQLAGQVSRLFMEYSLSRPELVADWNAKRPARSDENANERWQRHLWLSIFGDSAASGLNPRYSTLIDLLETATPEDLRLPETIHIFGFSYLAPAYYRVFGRLAQRTNLLVYALNPCREFWEDSAGRRGHAVGEAVAEQEALRQWGRPGREHVRALNALANFDFEARFVEPDDTTLLGRLQTDILNRTGAPSADASANAMQQDDSVRILACPSIQREIEIVGNEIWRLMQVNPDLAFNQIAVLICATEFAAYQAHIASVFGELHQLPHHIIDAPLECDSRVIEAFELLLELPFGNFTRPELLRVMTHPAVIGRYPDVDPAEWIDWAEQLGIVHGADHSDHANTYIDRDVFNWDQGLRRLALGAFMSAPSPGELTCDSDETDADETDDDKTDDDDRARISGSESAIAGNQLYVPEAIDEQQQASAARFALMTRSLVADARFCRRSQMTLTDWRAFFTCMIAAYLTPAGSSGERDLDRCRDAVAQLSALDLDGKPTSYRIACELLRSSLGKLRGSRGQPLAEGVTVAPMAPMRALPFRAVFVLGLGEGLFPARDDTSPLDLRSTTPNPSDVSANERDRYSLLETLVGTRDYLRLSYVARDVQTGETLEASSVITELTEMLANYLPSDPSVDDRSAPPAIVVHHPLRAFDRQYHPALFGDGDDKSFYSVSPVAYRQARALALRQDLERHLRNNRDSRPRVDAARALADPKSWPDIAACVQLRQAPPDLAGGPSIPQAIDLSLSTVRAFLEDPLQAWATVLGLRAGDHDDFSGRTDEPFATDTLRRAITLREVFGESLRSGADASSLIRRYRTRIEAAELSGHVPLGLFGEIDRQSQEAILMSWYQRLAELEALADPWTRYTFGRAPEGRATGTMLPPIQLTLSGPRVPQIQQDPESASSVVRLHGSTQLVGSTEHGSLILAPRSVRAKHHLTGFVDQLALAAAGEGSGRSHGVTAVGGAPGKAGLSRLALAAWSQREAQDYLTTLIGELLLAEHAYLLPFEAVFKHHRQRGDNQRSLVSVIHGSIAAADNRTRMGQGFSQGPVSRLDSVSIPSETEALAMVERRFSRFFERSEVLP